MRVCFLEDTKLHGGTQIWVAEAASIFLNNGIDVSVLTPTGGYVAEKCAEMGAEVYTYDFDEVISKKDIFKEIWKSALEDSDVAVCTIHPPRNGFHCSVFAAEVIDEFKLTTTLIPKTGTIVPEYKREYYKPDQDINYNVISITDFTKRYLIDEYKIPEEKVELIYQGTEVDKFTKNNDQNLEAQSRYKLPENAAPVLGSVGSFEERKGQMVLLESIDKIKSVLPDVHLMLVGDGPDEEKLKARVKEMNLQDNVSFFPFTSEPQFIFEKLDILVLSSLYKEGLPNVILEAMAMELPVVSSKLAGVPEVVVDGETGYMTEPGNADEIAKAVEKIFSDKENYKKMAMNARKLMASKFDKKNQFKAFADFFYKLTD